MSIILYQYKEDESNKDNWFPVAMLNNNNSEPITKRKPGGGRKVAYNEPTDTIAFRVPISHKESIKRIVKEYLLKLKK